MRVCLRLAAFAAISFWNVLAHAAGAEDSPDLATLDIDTQQIGKDNANVGNDGALNYSLPVRIPAGRLGLQPSLAISYNSGGGNGLLGVGWQLEGIPAIARANVGTGQLHWARQCDLQVYRPRIR